MSDEVAKCPIKKRIQNQITLSVICRIELSERKLSRSLFLERFKFVRYRNSMAIQSTIKAPAIPRISQDF